MVTPDKSGAKRDRFAVSGKIDCAEGVAEEDRGVEFAEMYASADQLRQEAVAFIKKAHYDSFLPSKPSTQDLLAVLKDKLLSYMESDVDTMTQSFKNVHPGNLNQHIPAAILPVIKTTIDQAKFFINWLEELDRLEEAGEV